MIRFSTFHHDSLPVSRSDLMHTVINLVEKTQKTLRSNATHPTDNRFSVRNNCNLSGTFLEKCRINIA